MSDKSSRQFVSRAGLKLEHALEEFAFDVSGFTCADFGCNVGGFTDCLLQRGAKQVYAIDTGYNVLAYTLRVDPRVVVMERTNALHAAQPQAAVDLVVIDMAWTQQRHALPAAVRWLGPHLPAGGGETEDPAGPSPQPLSPRQGEGLQGPSEASRVPPPFEGGGQGVGGASVQGPSGELLYTVRPSPQPLSPGQGEGLQGASGELRGTARPSPQPLSPGQGEGLRGRIITLVKPHYELSDAEKATLLHEGRLDPADAEQVLERVLQQMPQWGVRPLRWTRSPITGGKSSKRRKGPGNVEFLVLAEPV